MGGREEGRYGREELQGTGAGAGLLDGNGGTVDLAIIIFYVVHHAPCPKYCASVTSSRD